MNQSQVIKGIGFTFVCAAAAGVIAYGLTLVGFLIASANGAQILGDVAEGSLLLASLIGVMAGASFGIVRWKKRQQSRGERSTGTVDRWLQHANQLGIQYRIVAPAAFAVGLLISAFQSGPGFLVVVVNPLVIVTALARAVYVALAAGPENRQPTSSGGLMRFLLSLLIHAAVCFPPIAFLGVALAFGGGLF